MKCALCGGETVEATVVEEIRVREDHIMVPVKAEVCQDCSERYYPEGTIDYLIDLKERIWARQENMTQTGRVFKVNATPS